MRYPQGAPQISHIVFGVFFGRERGASGRRGGGPPGSVAADQRDTLAQGTQCLADSAASRPEILWARMGLGPRASQKPMWRAQPSSLQGTGRHAAGLDPFKIWCAWGGAWGGWGFGCKDGRGLPNIKRMRANAAKLTPWQPRRAISPPQAQARGRRVCAIAPEKCARERHLRVGHISGARFIDMQILPEYATTIVSGAARDHHQLS